MNSHYEIRFSGSGGQGIMVMGDILARAAGIYEGKEIVLTKSYGPESRGSACRSELIIDDGPINYPTVTRPDFVLAMTQLSCDKYHGDLKEDGALLIDSRFVKVLPASVKNLYSIPLTQLAEGVAGKAIAANIVALGAIAVLGHCADIASVRQSMIVQFPAAFREANEKAFAAGVDAARRMCHKNEF